MLAQRFQTTVIRGDRWKSAKATLLMALLTAFLGFGVASGKDVALLLPGLVVMGVVCLLGLVSTIRPPTLTLDETGLRLTSLRSWSVRWEDIERFRLINLRRSSAVMIDYRAGREAKGIRARLRRPTGLPGVLWMRPVELQELLQARLDAARAADPATLAPAEAAMPVAEPGTTFPWVSVALILVLCLVFAAEIAFPITAASVPLQPSAMTLMGFGGISRAMLTGPDQWYRFVASAFLHASLSHLLGNCIALFLAGRLLERVVGRGWFLAIYAFGALAGDLGSLLLNPKIGVSVGASGAIVALFAATYVCSFHFARTAGRYRLQSGAFAILVPTLLAFGRTAGGMTVDFGDHLGGALGGALAGFWLLRTWGPSSLLPARQRLGWVLAGLGGLAVAAAVWPGVARHAMFAGASRLAPAAVMPEDDAALIQQAHGLLDRYPDDPRLHLADAMDHLGKGDAASAETAAREGLKDPVLLHDVLTPRLEAALWQVLGEALEKQRRDDAAGEAYDKAAMIDPTITSIDYDRAEMHFNQGALDPALAGARRFGEHMPKAWGGWDLLGDIQFARGDIPAALRAYDQLQALQPSPAHRRVRGVARFYAGDGQGALDDLQAAASDEPEFLYGLLWLDIVRQRLNVPVPAVDPGQAGSATAWPGPVLAIFSDTFDPATLLEVAKAGPSKPGEDHVCEADFYTAEWDRAHTREADAKTGFAKAVQECPPKFVETWMAKAELRQATPASPPSP